MNIENFRFCVKSMFHHKVLSPKGVLLGNVHIFIVISQYNLVQDSIQFIKKYWFSRPQYFCDTDPSPLEMEWYLVSSYQSIYQVPCQDIHLSATCIAAVFTFNSIVKISLWSEMLDMVIWNLKSVVTCAYYRIWSWSLLALEWTPIFTF